MTCKSISTYSIVQQLLLTSIIAQICNWQDISKLYYNGNDDIELSCLDENKLVKTFTYNKKKTINFYQPHKYTHNIFFF